MGWECKTCTYLNDNSNLVCHLCKSAPPPGTKINLDFSSQPNNNNNNNFNKYKNKNNNYNKKHHHQKNIRNDSNNTDNKYNKKDNDNKKNNKYNKKGHHKLQQNVMQQQTAPITTNDIKTINNNDVHNDRRPQPKIPLQAMTGSNVPTFEYAQLPPSSCKVRVLCVGEKPSIAQTVAGFLSKHNISTHKGIVTPVHEFTGYFNGEAAKFIFTSVTGHVYGTDFQPGVESWDRTNPETLFTYGVRKVPTDKGQICRHLQKESKGIDYLVLWLDCDREGENICMEVIDNCFRGLKTSNKQCIYRAHFSSLTSNDIIKAMKSLRSVNINESLSVDARQELDLRMGVAFTRFQSKLLQNTYGDLKSRLISFGPCQTPTLGFCVARHDLIQRFVPEKYWVIVPNVTTADSSSLNNKYFNAHTFALEWKRGRVFNKEIAQMFYNHVNSKQTALIISVDRKLKKRARPMPLNTVEMLKIASKVLGIGPGECMHKAEALYTQGYISYPRTETTMYAPSFNLHNIVQQHVSHSTWGAYASELLTTGLANAKKGVDAGDHPPITPMRCASESQLDGNLWRLYDYICRHFLATVSPDATFTQTKVEFKIEEEYFNFSFNRTERAGFTSILHSSLMKDDVEINLEKGQVLNIANIELQERQTSPPDYLSESDLITLMEKHGIGTDASIPMHISSIIDRNFANISGNSRLVIPSTLGIVLVHGYYKIDPDLVKPTVRSEVERNLNLIANGHANFEQVVNHFIDILQKKFKYFVQKFEKMNTLFQAHFSTLEETRGRPLSLCGKCNKFMKYIAHKPYRLYCNTCDETYSLPQNGTIKLYMERTCPLDGFQLVIYSTGGKNGITFPLCPCCYNDPPFENFKKKNGGAGIMNCNMCKHPTCSFSSVATGVKICPEHQSCNGILIFDPTSGPLWKLVCNSCNCIVHYAEKAHKVKLLKNKCENESCNAQLFEIDFHREHSPLENNQTLYQGCLFCDELLKKTTEISYGHMRKKRNFKNKRRGHRQGIKMKDKDGKPTLEALLAHNG